VIVAPSRIDLITSTDSTVDVIYIDLPRETIKNCPEFNNYRIFSNYNTGRF